MEDIEKGVVVRCKNRSVPLGEAADLIDNLIEQRQALETKVRRLERERGDLTIPLLKDISKGLKSLNLNLRQISFSMEIYLEESGIAEKYAERMKEEKDGKKDVGAGDNKAKETNG